MIVLIGFMGAGKTSVGRRLAKRLDVPFRDSDAEIERRAGRRINAIFAREGEPYFREMEHAMVRDLVRGADAVLALGGGAVQDARTRAALAGATVVHLSVTYEQALARTGSDDRRPMLQRPDLRELYEERVGVYRDIAAITVVTDGRRPDAVVADILGRLGRVPQEPAQPRATEPDGES